MYYENDNEGYTELNILKVAHNVRKDHNTENHTGYQPGTTKSSSCSKTRILLVSSLVITIIAVISLCVLAVVYAKATDDNTVRASPTAAYKDNNTVRTSPTAAYEVQPSWTAWGSWGSCSITCGCCGKQYSRRTCASLPNVTCHGNSSKEKDCFSQTRCPVNGGWTSWSQYGSCSKSCGTGSHSRSRTCTNPSPAQGGLRCQGNSRESSNCNIRLCPVLMNITKSCPNGWVIYKSSCYKFIWSPTKTWSGAKAYCSILGSYLVEIKDSSENRFLRNHLQGFPDRENLPDIKNQFWIGNSDLYTEDNWVWASSGSHCWYTDWASRSNEPNGGREENCGSIHASLGYHWNDSECSLRLYFICEKQVQNIYA